MHKARFVQAGPTVKPTWCNAKLVQAQPLIFCTASGFETLFLDRRDTSRPLEDRENWKMETLHTSIESRLYTCAVQVFLSGCSLPEGPPYFCSGGSKKVPRSTTFLVRPEMPGTPSGSLPSRLQRTAYLRRIRLVQGGRILVDTLVDTAWA